jgi:Helix-turn-helix domain
MSSAAEKLEHSPWFDTDEAASYLKTKPGTLKNWRHRGEGPKYHIINKRLVRYHRAELDAYAAGETLR